MELDWFREYFVETTHTIDYALKDFGFESIIIERVGRIPMPLDITVTLENGKTKKFYIPLDIMRGEKGGRIF